MRPEMSTAIPPSSPGASLSCCLRDLLFSFCRAEGSSPPSALSSVSSLRCGAGGAALSATLGIPSSAGAAPDESARSSMLPDGDSAAELRLFAGSLGTGGGPEVGPFWGDAGEELLADDETVLLPSVWDPAADPASPSSGPPGVGEGHGRCLVLSRGGVLWLTRALGGFSGGGEEGVASGVVEPWDPAVRGMRSPCRDVLPRLGTALLLPPAMAGAPGRLGCGRFGRCLGL
mmetsp:Transcript_43404/g.108801  ORF Transcript_43404/g.108801 Transcript_43404/m.108801 type:complete len:231 (+) Transcript_43404:408-1100(+)